MCIQCVETIFSKVCVRKRLFCYLKIAVLMLVDPLLLISTKVVNHYLKKIYEIMIAATTPANSANRAQGRACLVRLIPTEPK